MPHVLLAIHSSPADFDTDCDYAVLAVSAELLHTIRRRGTILADVRKADDDFLEAYYWDGSLDYFSAADVAACQEALPAAEGNWDAQLDSQEFAVLTPAAAAEFSRRTVRRTECRQMILRTAGKADFTVHWEAYPKHVDATLRSPLFSLAQLEAIVAGATA